MHSQKKCDKSKLLHRAVRTEL